MHPSHAANHPSSTYSPPLTILTPPRHHLSPVTLHGSLSHFVSGSIHWVTLHGPQANGSPAAATLWATRLWNMQEEELACSTAIGATLPPSETVASGLLRHCIRNSLHAELKTHGGSTAAVASLACRAVLLQMYAESYPGGRGGATAAWLTATACLMAARPGEAARAELTGLLTSILAAYVQRPGSTPPAPSSSKAHIHIRPGWVPDSEAAMLSSIILTVGEGAAVTLLAKPLLRSHEALCIGMLRATTIFFSVAGEVATAEMEALMAKATSDGLDADDPQSLVNVIMLARARSASAAPSYGDWFASFVGQLGGAGERASVGERTHGRRAGQMLARALADLVPVDTAEFLRAHIRCLERLQTDTTLAPVRSAYADYIDLARTRLADLGEPLVGSGAQWVTGGGAGGEQHPQEALEEAHRAIGMFARARKMPQPILEMAIFRKKHFQNVFLPALLLAPFANLIPAAREADVPEDVNPTPKHREELIDALRSAGKIPPALDALYTEQQSTRLMAADGAGDTLDKYLADVETCALAVSQSAGSLVQEPEKQAATFSSAMNGLSRRLDRVLAVMGSSDSKEREGESAEQRTVICAWALPQLPAARRQVVDLLLNALGRGIASITSSCALLDAAERCTSAVRLWVRHCQRLMERHPALHFSIVVRLAHFLYQDGPRLHPAQVGALSQLCTGLHLSGASSPWVRLTILEREGAAKLPAIQVLLSRFSVQDSSWLWFSLRWAGLLAMPGRE